MKWPSRPVLYSHSRQQLTYHHNYLHAGRLTDLSKVSLHVDQGFLKQSQKYRHPYALALTDVVQSQRFARA